MGLFNFGKKSDPLDDLDLSGDSDHSGNSEHDSNNYGASDHNSFQQDSNSSSDPFSQPPQFSQTEQNGSNNFSSSQPPDPYSHYQEAVNNSPSSFHTSEQNNAPSTQSSDYTRNVDHSTELVLSKLDVLKAMIENLGHRIENLEQKYQYDKEQRKKSW